MSAYIHFENKSFPYNTNPDEITNNYLRSVFRFIADWNDKNAVIELQTSGSTGKPKKITVTKQQMQSSAEATLQFLNVKANTNALLCLNPDYIGGKMMIVRAIIGNFDLYVSEAKANPLPDYPNLDFELAAMVPYQVYQIINDNLNDLDRIRKLIIGGAPFDETKTTALDTSACACYESYGMTETVSHVALKRLNGSDSDNAFRILPDIHFGLDDRNCLWVQGAISNNRKIQTNDIIELIDKDRFVWKGRFDHVINSGGLKISPEEIEPVISELLQDTFNIDDRIMLAGMDDARLHSKLVLLIETKHIDHSVINNILDVLKRNLPEYKSPKVVYTLSSFSYTATGKLQRTDTLKKLIDATTKQ